MQIDVISGPTSILRFGYALQPVQLLHDQGTTSPPPGATHEIALVAKPARQQRVAVWKLPLLSALASTHSCWTLHHAPPLAFSFRYAATRLRGRVRA
jgi:hypothetical protein